MKRAPGRPPGKSGTREEILAEARRAFAELGFERATIRAIAARAGVDPALVCHYFGTKKALFTAALELPMRPPEVVAAALADPDHLGAIIVRRFLEAWEPPQRRIRLIAMLRSSLTNEAALDAVRTLLVREIFAPVGEALNIPGSELRATLVGSQFMGLAVMRYVVRLEPIASASVDELVAAVGPTVHRYLTADLSAV